MSSIFIEDLDRRLEEIKGKINQIKYIQEFDKARELEEKFQEIQGKINIMKSLDRAGDTFYYEAATVLDVLNFEIDDYMENEGKIKKQELNREIVLEKLKRFIEGSKEKSSEQLLSDLKELVEEIKSLEIEESLFSELYSLTAKALLCTLIQQAKDGETIDLGLVKEVTTAEAFADEIHNQLVTIAEAEGDRIAAYDILKVCQEINEEKIKDPEIWKILSGNDDVKIKDQESEEELPAVENQETSAMSIVPEKVTVLDKLIGILTRKDGTTVYTFGKLNEQTGQYEKVKLEYHSFPPKGRLLKRCRGKCIGLEINDVNTVNVNDIEEMSNLQSVTFGNNVHSVKLDGYLSERKLSERKESKLNEIVFSDDVERIGYEAFQGYQNLERVSFGESLTEIGIYSFAGCSKLKEVNIGKSLKEIGFRAFQGCISLRNIEIPDSVEKIDENAFDERVYVNVGVQIYATKKIDETYGFVPIKKKDADEWPQDLKEKMAGDGINFEDGDSEKE